MVSSYARTKEASQAKYISILNIIQGEVDPTQVSTDCLDPQYSEVYYLNSSLTPRKKSSRLVRHVYDYVVSCIIFLVFSAVCLKARDWSVSTCQTRARKILILTTIFVVWLVIGSQKSTKNTREKAS